MLADGLDADSTTPARGSTPLAVIEVAQRLVVQAGVAMRAVPRVFTILYLELEATTVIPAASSVRWWLQRLGLYALRVAYSANERRLSGFAKPVTESALYEPRVVAEMESPDSGTVGSRGAWRQARMNVWSAARRYWSRCLGSGKHWSVKSRKVAAPGQVECLVMPPVIAKGVVC